MWKKMVKTLAGAGVALVGAQALAATVAAYGPSVQSGTYIRPTPSAR
jgi:hypothetical protein